MIATPTSADDKGDGYLLKLSCISFLIQGIPESIAIIAFCYALLDLNFEWPRIIKQGLVLAISTYLIRLLPLPFGVHTIVVIFILVYYLARFSKVKLILAFKASLLTYIAIAIAEIFFNELGLRLLDLTLTEAYNNKFLWSLLGLPQVFLLFFLSRIIKSSPYSLRVKDRYYV